MRMESTGSLIRQLASEYRDEIISVRRHFHRNPELSREEFETAAFISRKLGDYGIPHKTGVAGTGIVGIIEGLNPSRKCIALRADMDALPIREENEVAYRSQAEGKMHACGHDVHMASLLGTAKILTKLTGRFEGTVKLLFQPSEETYPGGAITMINEGVLENPAPEVVIGQHVINTLEAGDAGMKGGQYMASTDEVFITVNGKGGHAATPNQVIDPVLIAAHILVALQQIVSRNADPNIPTVISFGRIIGEGRTNVIPATVRMEGTVRTYDEAWRAEVHRRIRTMACSIAEGMGATCEVRVDGGYPFLFNDLALTEKLSQMAAGFLGQAHVKELDKRMTAEDFAYFAQHVPSCLYRLGITTPGSGIGSNLHTATFDVDENCLETGMGLMAWFAVNLLAPQNS